MMLNPSDPDYQRRGILANRRTLANIITTIAVLTIIGGLLLLICAGGGFQDDMASPRAFLVYGITAIATGILELALASCLRQFIDNAESLHRIEQSLSPAN
jgi:hypothetical protein